MSEGTKRGTPSDTAPEWVDLSLSREQVWMIYDLVAARAETICAKEWEIGQGLGGAPWTRLCGRLRSALDRSKQPHIDSSRCELHSNDPRDDMAAFIGHKGLGDEFVEWALAQRAEIDRLLEDES